MCQFVKRYSPELHCISLWRKKFPPSFILILYNEVIIVVLYKEVMPRLNCITLKKETFIQTSLCYFLKELGPKFIASFSKDIFVQISLWYFILKFYPSFIMLLYKILLSEINCITFYIIFIVQTSLCYIFKEIFPNFVVIF